MKNKLEKIHLSIDNETKCYVSYDDYKKMEKSYKDKLKNKSIKEESKIGDEVKWCGLDWYVIKLDSKLKRITIDLPGFAVTNEDTITLMLKDTLESMTYSDNNSNDYEKSNVKKYLETKFIKQLDKNKLLDMQTNYDENKYAYTKVRIPTLREIEALPMNIRKSNNWYWTMTASYAKSEDCSYAHVFFVDTNGDLYWDNVSATYGLRPVITLSTDELE